MIANILIVLFFCWLVGRYSNPKSSRPRKNTKRN